MKLKLHSLITKNFMGESDSYTLEANGESINVFVDNAESVSIIEPTESQQIRLYKEAGVTELTVRDSVVPVIPKKKSTKKAVA